MNEQQAGRELAEMLQLTRKPNERYDTRDGDKTETGLYRTIKRFMDEVTAASVTDIWKATGEVEGFHNTLWQIIVNDSLEGSEAAFVNIPGHTTTSIALGDGGYLSANAVVDNENVDRLNKLVFDLTPDEAILVVGKSMRG